MTNNPKDPESPDQPGAAAPADLEQIRRIRGALRELPPVVPEPQLFEQIMRAHEDGEKQGWEGDAGRRVGSEATNQSPGWRLLRYPMATAAVVFVATLISSALWLPGLDRSTPDMQPIDGLAHLVNRSRELESAVHNASNTQTQLDDSTERALLFRIADIDAELTELQQEDMHPELRERLWRQRVELLETMMEIQRHQLREQAQM